MNKKQPETTEKTKQAIKDAFWDLYKLNRIEAISVKDITGKAGYNRTTFYAYFKDVYDVLEQIEEGLMPGVEHLPPIDLNQNNNQDFMVNIMTFYEKNSEYYSVLLSDKGDPRFAQKIKQLFKAMMRETLADRLDRPDDETDYALEFLVSATLATLKYWYDQDKKMPIERLMPMMYKLMDNRFAQELGILKGGLQQTFS